MEQSKKQILLSTLEMIRKDTYEDAKNFEGKPFDGKTVATYFGYIGAQIAALSDIIKQLINENRNTSDL